MQSKINLCRVEYSSSRRLEFQKRDKIYIVVTFSLLDLLSRLLSMPPMLMNNLHSDENKIHSKLGLWMDFNSPDGGI